MTASGERAVSALGDKTLKVWDLKTSLPIATFACDAKVRHCVFVDNRTIVGGDDGGHVHFLRLEE